MSWNVYLSGEIHTDWRRRVVEGAKGKGLDVAFSGPVEDHGASDAAGDLLAPESTGFWRDHKSAKVNGLRTRTLLGKCDTAVIRFGDQYKQWNAAFDAGQAAALGKPLIVMHDESLIHPLKEVDAAALAVASDADQIVRLLRYVIEGKL